MIRLLQIPALADSTRHLGFALVLQYFVQGLPFGLLTVAVPAYLAERGVSAAAVGAFLGLSFLPWTLKPLWAALLDRWSQSPMGRRRPWLVLSHAGMLVSLASMLLLPDPLAELGTFTALCALLGVFTSMQDLATDAMAVELVQPHHQTHANGLMWGSKTLGVAAATAAGAWLLDADGLPLAIQALMLPIAIALLVSLLLREQDGERWLPWMGGESAGPAEGRQAQRWAEVWRALRSAAFRPPSLRVASSSFLFHVALGLIGAALPVFAVHELDWSALSYSRVAASSRLFAGLFALVFAGLLVRWLGQRRLLAWGALLMVATVVTLSAFPALWSLDRAVVVFLFAYKTLATLLIVILLAVCMGLCRRSVAAVQFSLYTAVANLGLATGPLLLGPIHGPFGYGAVFAAAAGLCAAMLLLMRRVRLDRLAGPGS